MPQELKKVNGQWVWSGSQRSTDLVPHTPPPKQGSTSTAKPKPKPPPRPWWSRALNDAQYEANRLRTAAARGNLSGELMTGIGRATSSVLGTAQQVRRLPTQQVAIGTIGAVDNAAKMGYSLYQRHVQKKPKADPTSGRFGNALDQTVENVYRTYGATPPSQMSQGERQLDSFRRSVYLNVGVAPLTPALGFLRAAPLLRGGAQFAINELLSNYLDDNTGGNIVNLINDTTGAKLPGAVNVGQDDMVTAGNKSLAPNAAAGVALGAGVGAAIGAGRNIRRNIRAHRAMQREVAERAKQESMGLLQKDEADGLSFTQTAQQPVQPAPAPAVAKTPAEEFQQANAAMEAKLGMTPKPEEPPAAAAPVAPPEPRQIPSVENATTETFAKPRDASQPLPEADPTEDVWADWDPSLPESTALGKVVGDMSDAELQTALSSPGVPVVDRVNQIVEARAAVDAPPPLAAQMVMAPADRLAEDYLAGVTRKLGGREDWELRPLFDPDTNPGLWSRAQAITGVDSPADMSKADMLDTLTAVAAEDGQVPIVNRMMGTQMMPAAEITPAPQVFQYKGGTNDAGEQIGNSLSGVERWDPNAEGIVQVWRDAKGEIGDAGRVYVVNGHNRLAAANRMGIPSLRVEFLDAPTAAEARLQGAVANVSDGKGTVFDAAKLAREYGITDPSQLKALGKPGASGFWKEGIAMGRLPEDVFLAAVNEQIPLRRAVIIGESGTDEETMRSAYRYLVQQGPENVKEGSLREMLAMAQASPAASSADAGRQGDLLSGTEWGQSFNQGMLAKADLAAAVRKMLSSEKKLFGTVGRQAGKIERVGQVDAGAAKEISGEAGRALNIFDDLKYQTGPVSDLLNEGTQRVVNGEDPAAVANGIKNRLAAAINEAMGKEVAAATDVVQEDMFGGAAKQADTPAELSADQRLAAEAQLLQEAIANGEVRPPDAPIPDLPEPAMVRLDQIDPAEPITPGSKAAQAAADELRLAVEHAQSDAAMKWETKQAVRDGTDYEALTFEQKKQQGLAQGVDKPATQDMPQAAAASEASIAPPPQRPEPLRVTEQEAAPRVIEIPAAADKKLYVNNIKDAATFLMRWANAGLPENRWPIKSFDQARAIVQAKGRRLWAENVPGIDLDQAMNDMAMGRNSQAVQDVSSAYRQFYGVSDPTPPPKVALQRQQRQIDAIDQQMADLRQKAEQEGC